MQLRKRSTWLQAGTAALVVALVAMGLKAPVRELLIAFGSGALFAWLFMRLVAPRSSSRGDPDAARAWQDTVPRPYQEPDSRSAQYRDSTCAANR